MDVVIRAFLLAGAALGAAGVHAREPRGLSSLVGTVHRPIGVPEEAGVHRRDVAEPEEDRGRGMVVIEPPVRRADESHRGDGAHGHASANSPRATHLGTSRVLSVVTEPRRPVRAGLVDAPDERLALDHVTRRHRGVQPIRALRA